VLPKLGACLACNANKSLRRASRPLAFCNTVWPVPGKGGVPSRHTASSLAMRIAIFELEEEQLEEE
jgi:hypothetical protein